MQNKSFKEQYLNKISQNLKGDGLISGEDSNLKWTMVKKSKNNETPGWLLEADIDENKIDEMSKYPFSHLFKLADIEGEKSKIFIDEDSLIQYILKVDFNNLMLEAQALLQRKTGIMWEKAKDCLGTCPDDSARDVLQIVTNLGVKNYSFDNRCSFLSITDGLEIFKLAEKSISLKLENELSGSSSGNDNSDRSSTPAQEEQQTKPTWKRRLSGMLPFGSSNKVQEERLSHSAGEINDDKPKKWRSDSLRRSALSNAKDKRNSPPSREGSSSTSPQADGKGRGGRG